MSSSLSSLEEQRQQALDQMRTIDRMRRGSLSRQFLKQYQQGQTITRGPYFLLQGFFKGKKFAERIPAEEAPQVEGQVRNYQTFQALAERVVTLTDQITRMAGADKDSKKNSSRRRSPTNVSGKPKRS